MQEDLVGFDDERVVVEPSSSWEPATWPAPEGRPSAAEIFGGHMSGLGSDGAAEMLKESYTHRL